MQRAGDRWAIVAHAGQTVGEIVSVADAE